MHYAFRSNVLFQAILVAAIAFDLVNILVRRLLAVIAAKVRISRSETIT